MSTKERCYNWDYLRFLASVAVVLLHVSYSYMSVVSVDDNRFVIMGAYNALTRFAVPVFFMLSGLFLLDPAKEMSLKDCLKRTAKLFAFFYFWSAFYAFQGLAVDWITGEAITKELVSGSLQRFITGHGHMWFIFRLGGYYLMLPIARAISANKKALTWFCMFWMTYRFVLPTLSIWLPLDFLNMWISQFDFQFMVSYFGYLFLGYWLKVIEIPKKLRVLLYFSGGASIVAIFVLTLMESQKKGQLFEGWLSPTAFFPLLFAISVFVFFKHFDTSRKEKYNVIVSKLARYSLIIYILHPFFIEKLNMLGINTDKYNPLWSIPVLTVFIVVGCVVAAWIIYKLPIKIARL